MRKLFTCNAFALAGRQLLLHIYPGCHFATLHFALGYEQAALSGRAQSTVKQQSVSWQSLVINQFTTGPFPEQNEK